MTTTRRRLLAATAAGAVFAPAIVPAQQDWPNRQIRIVIPYPAGGPSDATTRIVIDKAAALLRQSVLFENKAGASGAIGAEAVKNSPADGYTFLTTTTAMVAITPHLQPLPYHQEKDFATVARMATSWVGMGVHPSVPANTLKEFVDYARANPGKVNFASAGLATITQLYGEMLNIEADIKMVHVPYKGSAPALQDLLGGQVQVQFDPVTLPHIKAGRLKGLAIVGAARWPDKPDIPTLKEQGYGKDGGDAWFGILAPGATPAPIIEKFSTAIGEALKMPEVIEKLRGTAHFTSYLAPAAFRDTITRESKAFAEIIRRGNIKV